MIVEMVFLVRDENVGKVEFPVIENLTKHISDLAIQPVNLPNTNQPTNLFKRWKKKKK